jgi:DoxX-like family
MHQPNKAMRIASWVISGFVGFSLTASAIFKFISPPELVENMTKVGFPVAKLPVIGVIELAAVVLYLVPKTALLGLLLITAYLGGATAVHVRADDPFMAPVFMGLMALVGYVLRRPDVVRTSMS